MDGTRGDLDALLQYGRTTARGTAMTRKDITMEWDQIERKWAAMTRRVRADCPIDRLDATSPVLSRDVTVGGDMKSINDSAFPSLKDTNNVLTAE